MRVLLLATHSKTESTSPENIKVKTSSRVKFASRNVSKNAQIQEMPLPKLNSVSKTLTRTSLPPPPTSRKNIAFPHPLLKILRKR